VYAAHTWIFFVEYRELDIFKELSFFMLFYLVFCLFLKPFEAQSACFAEGRKSVVEWAEGQEHDFGTMVRERPQTYIFRFKNTALDTIVLQTVRTSCGCTAARWTETPVAPGASGEVSIEYDAYQVGDFNKKIRVFFDVQRKPEILRIKGVVQ
jgi:hypothetical protein